MIARLVVDFQGRGMAEGDIAVLYTRRERAGIVARWQRLRVSHEIR